jgi:hypothetical protein
MLLSWKDFDVNDLSMASIRRCKRKDINCKFQLRLNPASFISEDEQVIHSLSSFIYCLELPLPRPGICRARRAPTIFG